MNAAGMQPAAAVRRPATVTSLLVVANDGGFVTGRLRGAIRRDDRPE